MAQTSGENTFYEKYLRLVAAAGLGISVFSATYLQWDALDWQFAALIAFALALGSKIVIRINFTRTSVSIIDVFSFMVFLLYGCSAAVLLGTAEAYISSGRHSKNVTFRLFNAGAISISLFLAFEAAEFVFGEQIAPGIIRLTPQAVGTMGVVVLVHYLANTGIVAFASSFRHKRALIDVWKEHYLWMFVPFTACGSAALVSAALINYFGFIAFVIMMPIVGVIYFGYRSYHEKLEAVTARAALAAKHLVDMRESEERFRAAFSNAPIGMAIVSSEGEWIQINESLTRLLGRPADELTSRSIREIIYQNDIVEFLGGIGSVLQGKADSFKSEVRLLNRDGKIIWTQTNVSPLEDSQRTRLILQVEDISARRIAEESLRYNAFHDSLTNLANRAMFMGQLDELISRRNSADCAAVIFLDLDRFKVINDTVGHTVGDKVLVSVAARIRNSVPSDAVVARFGSDEFLILLDDVEGQRAVTDLVEELERQMSLVHSVAGQEINVTASVGIVFIDAGHESSEDVLRDADMALHLAKKRGRHCHVVFDEGLRAAMLQQHRLERDLYRALERNELYVVYQPIVSIRDRSLKGFEALVRWEHPEFGSVSPADFIPLAEENGLIVEIGEFVLESACRQISDWRDMFGDDFGSFVAVNVSSRQLLQKNLLERVIQSLENHGVPPSQLKLEITESVVVENSELMIAKLKQFRALGVRLSMDDFGTGYSSLSYLHSLPIQTLKIDRSFVKKIGDKRERAEIVKTILLLARNLRLETVAEGIENIGQLDFLAVNGCDLGQGFLFAKPLSAANATTFIAESSRTPPLDDRVRIEHSSVFEH